MAVVVAVVIHFVHVYGILVCTFSCVSVNVQHVQYSLRLSLKTFYAFLNDFRGILANCVRDKSCRGNKHQLLQTEIICLCVSAHR